MRKFCRACDREHPPRLFRCPACNRRLELASHSDVEGKFVVKHLIADGGMSQVYLAHQNSLGRDVALKVVHLDPSESFSIDALRNEAFLAGRVQHPHVVSVLDHGEVEGGFLYLAMEYLNGASLAETLFRSGPMEYVRALRILTQICEALAAIHDVGLVYRDLKPGNIFLVDARGSKDFVKMLDFGICVPVPRQPMRLLGTALPACVTAGTPQYMAPEQILGHPVDPRTDLYALGITAFEMLTGKPVFDGPDVFTDHLRSVPLPLAIVCPQSRIPRGLDDFLLRLMAKDPAHRPQNAREVLDRFRQLLPSSFRIPPEITGENPLPVGADPGWYESGRTRVTLKAPAWVDRPREMAWVEAEFANLEQDHPGLLWIEGEPGAGKTTLSLRAQDAATERGMDSIRCTVEVRMPLLGAWRCALLDLLQAEIASRDDLRAAVSRFRLGPLHDGDPTFEALSDLLLPGAAAWDLLRRDPSAYLSFAASGIERLLRAASVQGNGLLVHLDDFHNADPLSAEFLDRLVRSLEARPAPLVLLVCARRLFENENEERTPEFFRARATFREHGALQKLTRMTERQVDALVNAMCPVSCDPSVHRVVRRAAGGNPLFAVQMCRHLATRGMLVLTKDRVRLADEGDVSVPGALMELLVQRIEGLRSLPDGPLLVDLLDRVSLLGSRASITNLWALCDSEGRLDLRDGLDRLVDRLAAEGYVQRVPWASDDYVSFPHPLMRDAITQRQPASSLSRLHLFVARVLESAYADNVSVASQDIGEHYFEAGFFDRAIDYLLVAAERSLEAARLVEARDLFTKAETAFTRIGLPEDPRLGRVLAALVELDWCQGRYDAAAERLSLLSQHPLVPAGTALAIRIGELEACVAEARRDTAGAVRVLQRLIHEAGAAGDRHRAATAMVRLANIRMDEGDNAAAARLVRDAELQVQQDGKTRTMGLVHLAYGRLMRKMGTLAESIGRLDEALALLTGPRDFTERAEALFFKGARLAGQEMRQEAIEVFREGVALCESFGFARGLAAHLANLGACLVRVGHEDEGRECIQRSLALREAMGDSRGVAHALTALADLALVRRDWPLVRDLSRKALNLCHAARYVMGERVALVNLAHACRGLGLRDEAEEHLLACLGTTRQDKSLSVTIGSAHELMAGLLEEKGDASAALRERLNAIQVFERLELFDRAQAVRARLGFQGGLSQACPPEPVPGGSNGPDTVRDEVPREDTGRWVLSRRLP